MPGTPVAMTGGMFKRLLAAAAAAASVFAVAPAEAACNLVYIAGRTQTQWDGTVYGKAGCTTQYVRYDAWNSTLMQANVAVRSQLAGWCSGGNTCVIVAYSNGMHQVAYTQANYPESLTGLSYIQGGGNAYGGSNLLDGFTGSLADILGVIYEPGVDTYLHVSSARNAYNHNLSNGKVTYQIGGNTNAYNWIWAPTAGFLPGDDDGVVSYHSAFGCTGSGSQSSGCAKWTGRTNRCVYDSGYCSSGECGGGLFSAGTDHFGIDNKAAYCF